MLENIGAHGWPFELYPVTPADMIVRGGTCDWQHYDISNQDVRSCWLLHSIVGLEPTL